MNIELIRQINALPISERVELIEEISRGLRRDMKEADRSIMSKEKKRIRSEAIRKLRGIASVPGKQPPTDEEWREERTNYLLEKHQ